MKALDKSFQMMYVSTCSLSPLRKAPLVTLTLTLTKVRSGAEANTERCANFPTIQILYCIGVSRITTQGFGLPRQRRPVLVGG